MPECPKTQAVNLTHHLSMSQAACSLTQPWLFSVGTIDQFHPVWPSRRSIKGSCRDSMSRNDSRCIMLVLKRQPATAAIAFEARIGVVCSWHHSYQPYRPWYEDHCKPFLGSLVSLVDAQVGSIASIPAEKYLNLNCKSSGTPQDRPQFCTSGIHPLIPRSDLSTYMAMRYGSIWWT